MSMKNKKIFSAMLIAVAMLLGINTYAQENSRLNISNQEADLPILASQSAGVLYGGALTDFSPISEFIGLAPGSYTLYLKFAYPPDSSYTFEIYVTTPYNSTKMAFPEGEYHIDFSVYSSMYLVISYESSYGTCFYRVETNN